MSVLNVKTDQVVFDAIQDEFELTVGPILLVDAVNAITLNSRVLSSSPTSHTFQIESRWSRNGEEYSHYQILQEMIDGIGDVAKLWLKIRVRITGFPADGFLTVLDSIDIDYDTPVIEPDEVLCKCAKEITSCLGDANNYNPYDIGPAICFYQELNMMVNETFGLPTDYYKLDPESGSGDIILREYTLYNTRDLKRIKIVVPRNEFPENRLTWTIEGSEYEQGFEVQIDKGYYEKYLGKDTYPRKNDIIHFLINDRLYEIRSVFLFRDFMQQGLFYKIILQKYQPKTQTKAPKSELSRQTIEQSIISSEKLFGDDTRGEIKDIVKVSQEPVTLGRDLVRIVNSPQCIIPIKQTFNYTKIADGYYNLAVADGGVEYKQDITLGENESCTISFWYKTSSDQDSPIITSGINGYIGPPSSSVALKTTLGSGRLTFAGFSAIYPHEHGQWYACVIDMSNEFMQIGIEVFKADESTRLLESVTSVSTPITNEGDFYGTIKLAKSNVLMTSIRITKQLVQEKDRRLFLMQYNVAQARKAIVVDNVAQILETESYTRPK